MGACGEEGPSSSRTRGLDGQEEEEAWRGEGARCQKRREREVE